MRFLYALMLLAVCSSAHADVVYTPAEEQALELALQAAVHAIDPSKGITRERFCAEALRLLPELDIPANPATLRPLMRPFVNQARDLCGMHLFNNKSATLGAPSWGAFAMWRCIIHNEFFEHGVYDNM